MLATSHEVSIGLCLYHEIALIRNFSRCEFAINLSREIAHEPKLNNS